MPLLILFDPALQATSVGKTPTPRQRSRRFPDGRRLCVGLLLLHPVSPLTQNICWVGGAIDCFLFGESLPSPSGHSFLNSDRLETARGGEIASTELMARTNAPPILVTSSGQQTARVTQYEEVRIGLEPG